MTKTEWTETDYSIYQAMIAHKEESLLLMTAGLMGTMKRVESVPHTEVLWEMLRQKFAEEIQQQKNL